MFGLSKKRDYVGIVIDRDPEQEHCSVPEHLTQGKYLLVLNQATGKLEKKVDLDGIETAKQPGLRLYDELNEIGLKAFESIYSGRKLKVWTVWPFRKSLKGVRNIVAKGETLDDIITKLKGDYVKEAKKTYAAPPKPELAGAGAY